LRLFNARAGDAFPTFAANRGVKVAVLYATYLPLPTNSW
jgi:hypothetical protein